MGTNLASGSIKVPAELQLSLGNALEQIKKLRTDLSNVSKDSKFYNGIDKALTNMQKKAEKLAQEMATPFRNQTEINQFEKHLNSLFDDLTGFKNKTKDLGFDDLLFSASDMKVIEDKKKEISELKTKLDSLYSDSAKKAQTSFNNLFPKEAIKQGTDYKNTIDALDDKLKDLNKQAEVGKSASSNIDNEMAQIQQENEKLVKQKEFVQTIASGTNPNLHHSNGRKMFSFLWENDQEGKKSQLIDQALENGMEAFGTKLLETTSVGQAEQVAKKVENELNARIQENNKNLQNLKINKSETQKNLQNTNDKIKQVQDIKTQAESGIKEEYSNTESEIEKLTNALTEFINKLIQANGFMQDTDKVLDTANDGYNKTRTGIEQMTSSMSRLAQVQNTLGGIKNTISNFMNFYQVMNIVKNAITSMISTVRDLDSVMTQIAIVTDMSQSDLWGQMETYSSLASQYGTSIKGVYEVSQLYY
jgi:chromosome segregation ATPase